MRSFRTAARSPAYRTPALCVAVGAQAARSPAYRTPALCMAVGAQVVEAGTSEVVEAGPSPPQADAQWAAAGEPVSKQPEIRGSAPEIRGSAPGGLGTAPPLRAIGSK